MENRSGLNLKQLKVFHLVAHHMNFTKAASDLFITQPAVTMAIDSLEESLGARLFTRGRNQLALTEAGLVLKPFAERISRLANEAEDAVSALTTNPHGVLRFGTTKTFARYLLPQYMLNFYKNFPRIRIQMNEGSSNEIVRGVMDGHYDIAVVGRINYGEEVETMPFPGCPSDPLQVVMNVNHRLAGLKKVSIRDLAKEPLLLREKGSGMRAKVLELFSKAGIVPNIVLEASNLDFTKELIRRGAGIGILGLMSVSEELKGGEFKTAALGDEDLAISIDLVLPVQGYRSMATRSFLEFLKGGDSGADLEVRAQ